MRKRGKKSIRLDLRYFRRYSKEGPCTVYCLQESRLAKMLDYSFDGLSVITVHPLRIGPGDQLTVDIPELNIRQRGRVRWTAPADAGTRLGIAKTGVLEGSFLHFPLSDILIGLHRALKTGVLVVQHGETMKKLYIRNGDMINAGSNQDADQLGKILLRQKKLTEEHYRGAMEEEKKTGRHHSEILIRNAHLKPEHLVSAPKLQGNRLDYKPVNLKPLTVPSFEPKKRTF